MYGHACAAQTTKPAKADQTEHNNYLTPAGQSTYHSLCLILHKALIEDADQG